MIHFLKARQGNMKDVSLIIDFSNAYDYVDWGYIRGLISMIRFNGRMID